jgi:hypothetical protein
MTGNSSVASTPYTPITPKNVQIRNIVKNRPKITVTNSDSKGTEASSTPKDYYRHYPIGDFTGIVGDKEGIRYMTREVEVTADADAGAGAVNDETAAYADTAVGVGYGLIDTDRARDTGGTTVSTSGSRRDRLNHSHSHRRGVTASTPVTTPVRELINFWEKK